MLFQILRRTKLRKHLKLLFQILMTALFFWWIVKNISLLDLWHTILQANSWLILLSCLLGLYCVLVSAQQWQVLLNGTGQKIKLSILTALYLIGITFNQFLPTGLGGDVVKVVLLRRMTLTGTTSARSVIAARLTGFVGMLLVGVTVAVIRFPLFLVNISLFHVNALLLIILMAVAYISVLVLIFHPVTLSLMESFAKRFPRLKLGKVYEVQKAIADYRNNPRTLISSILVGGVFWVATIVNHYVLGRAIGIDISPWYFFVLVPVALTLSMVPISVNGFGVREGMFALLLATAHVPQTHAVTLALLMDLQAILLAVVGGVLFLLKESFLPKPVPQVPALDSYEDLAKLATVKMSALVMHDITMIDTFKMPIVRIQENPMIGIQEKQPITPPVQASFDDDGEAETLKLLVVRKPTSRKDRAAIGVPTLVKEEG